MVFSQDTETGKEKTSKFYLARDIEEAVKLREDKHWALKAERCGLKSWRCHLLAV